MRRTFTNTNKFTYIKAIHKKNYSLTKSLRLTASSITPCPIKPTENIIPKDLNLQKIFTNMLKSSQDLSNKYSPSIIKKLYSNITLNIDINSKSRKTILGKMRDFFLYYNIDYKIYFKSILLYDIISIESQTKQLLSSIEEKALGSLILSIKFNYDENKMFSMKKFLQFSGEKIYSLQEIITIERNALQTINYFLNFTTPMCFLEFFLLNGIIYNVDYVDKSDYAKIYFETENILGKIMEDSENYLKYNFFYLACSVVSFCREKFNLERWPKMLKKVFSVDFYFFQNEYKFFFEKKNDKKDNNKINKIYSHNTYNAHNKKDIIVNGNNNLVLLDLKSLNNHSNNNLLKNQRNFIYDSYKRNYCKTIDHYNNIINININNVSINNIYNSSIDNNLKETKLKSNRKSNRFHYKINNNSIYYSNDDQKNNEYVNNQNDSFKNNIKNEVISKNESEEIFNDNNYNLMGDLAEIKEVKDLGEENFTSPPKRKRKHYFLFKKDNENNKIEESKKKENEKIIEEIPKNDKVYKERSKYSYIRKKYNYTTDNSIKKNLNSENEIDNTLKNKTNKIEFNFKSDKYNQDKNNIVIRNGNEEINRYKYYKTKENSSIDKNIININNIKNENDKEIIEENKNENNSPDKRQNNGLISKYFNFTYYKTEKKNNDKIYNYKNKYNINNIKPTRIENENKIFPEKTKNNILSIGKYQSSRIKNSYRFYKNNLENKNNLYKINENSQNNSTKKDNKIEVLKYDAKDIQKNKKKHKGDNKNKYNDLIKHKLFMSDAINKRKNY